MPLATLAAMRYRRRVDASALSLPRRMLFSLAIGGTGWLLMLLDELWGVTRHPLEETLDPVFGDPHPTPGPTLALSRHTIPSGTNLLDAVLAEPTGQPTRASLLLCHGIGETVEHWHAAQRLLAGHGIRSLVFNYSGYGRSTGWVDAAQSERDAVAAYAFLERTGRGEPVSLLGFSLGSGVAAAVAGRLRPHRLILCAAFPSLREAARCFGVPSRLATLLPDIWEASALLASGGPPVLILQGDADQLFPAQLARELAHRLTAASTLCCELVVVPGLSHNEPIDQPSHAYWARVVSHVTEQP